MFAELESLAGVAKFNEPRLPRIAVVKPVVDAQPATESPKLERFGKLYGACAAMKQLFATIERAAPTSATVMILGQSGSGKELVAESIHELSERSAQPFVAVNCGAIAETLIESELFGHEKGSFTGAARQHRGCFERATKGTLFLDEIAEMPIDMQVRLLRVLETGRFTRVGGDDEIDVDVRVIAATNRSLKEAVAAGKLRADLMYRLCVIPIEVPPLAQRDGDAVLLAEKFLDEQNHERGTDKRYTRAAREAIAAYGWPGNVRELRNVVQRAFVMSDRDVDVDIDGGPSAVAGEAAHELPGAKPIEIAARRITVTVGTSLEDAERALILTTLDAVEGSRVQAAKILGISLKTLYNRLHAYKNSPRANEARGTAGYRLTVVS
jgi:DNA-binding NtrC family response regulator